MTHIESYVVKTLVFVVPSTNLNGIWRFPKMEVPLNDPSILGIPYYWKASFVGHKLRPQVLVLATGGTIDKAPPG